MAKAKAKSGKNAAVEQGERPSRPPCAHVDSDGRCANEDSNCTGVKCSSCEDYKAGSWGDLIPPKAGELRLIPIDDLFSSRHQVRSVEGSPELDAGIDELAASIKASGLAQPITVRKATPWECAPGRSSRDGGYELIAGHRRLAACKRAGVAEVPCYVLDVNNAEAADLTLVENLQRKDLTAIEEADTVKRMLEAGRTKEEIAQASGKSVRWVYRRASVGNLIVAWRTLAVKFRTSAAFCEGVAKYPADVQEKVFKEMGAGDCEPDDDDWTSSHFKGGGNVRQVDMVAARALGRLSACPWAGKRSWCVGCGKRTDAPDQVDLFDALIQTGAAIEDDDDDDEDLKGAQCLDPRCWAEKLELWVAEQQKELKAKAGQLIEANGNTYWHFRNSGTKVKTKNNTVPVLVVEGPNTGDVYWVPARSEDGDGEQGVSARPKGPTPKQKQMAAYARAVTTIVQGADDPEFDHDGETVSISLDTLIALVVALGCHAHSYAPKGIEAWCSAKRTKAVFGRLEGADGDDKRDILWRLVRPGVLVQMKFDTVSCCESAHANCEELVRVLGIPDGMIRAALAAGGKGRGRAAGVEADPEEED
jgi:ParB/RepB/Spo0J family partition protein